MKLVFRKNDQEEITVLQSLDGDERKFVYTEMINVLIDKGELEGAVIEGDFTVDEQRSINDMVTKINEVTKEASEAADGSIEADDTPPL